MATPDQDVASVRRRNARSQLHRIGPVVALLFGIYALVKSYRLSLGELTNPGPGLWPFMVSMLITAVAAILLVIDDPDDYESWTRGSLLILGGLLSLGVFIALFKVLGFLIPAVLMLLLWLKVFGEEPWRWAVPLAFGGALLLHLLFVEALGVPFPEGPILGIGIGVGVGSV